MSEWKTYRLSELIHLVGGGTPKTTVTEYWNGEIPWLSVVDFGKGIKKVYQTEKSITEKGLNESSTKILKEGQIIISARGTVGELAVLGRDMAFNQSCYGIYANDKTENNFLYYLLKYSIGKIKKNTHGAVFDTITKQTFDNIEVAIPESNATQTQIAQILSSLDDKIELNLQMNQTLEAMAQAIFKEWFVNFNFPGFDGELVDGLPKGWKNSELNEIISFVVDNRGKTPPIIEDEREGIPLIEVNALINSPVVAQQHLAKKFVDEETYTNWFRKGHPKKGDVLFSTVGSIGEMAISFGEQICIAQNIIALRSKFKGYFLYFTLKSIKQNLLSLDISSVQPSIKVPHLLKQEIIVPSDGIINEFENTLSPLLERIFENEMEIRVLTQIRDSLLPKLMTGKIEIQA